MTRRPAAVLAAGLLASLLLPATVVQAPGLAAAPAVVTPPGLPGPPPSNGADLPASPGTTVTPAANSGAATISATTGPGLLRDASNTTFKVRSRSFKITIACQAKGTVKVTSPVIRGTVGTGSYKCSSNRATIKVSTSKATAARINKLNKVATIATVKQSGRKTPMSVTLLAGGKRSKPGAFWTDGHLSCVASDGVSPLGTVVMPYFTYKEAIPVSVRAWVATYTTKGGWHWTGVRGPNRGRWDTWTSSATGIVEWPLDGAVPPQPVPWSWGAITYPAGQGTSAVGVYEIVYWSGGGPKWQWGYINAGSTGWVAAGGVTPYCTYP
jgi:hypothetical protein